MSKSKRDKVVAMALSREEKNNYTRGSKRTMVGDGYSDNASFIRWCYLTATGKDIGCNVAAQITNKSLRMIDKSEGKPPREASMLPGDLLFFRGADASYPFHVGHIEMYIGDGKIIGHGSGIGPTVKNMRAYATARHKQDRDYICAMRVIPRSPAELLRKLVFKGERR